MAVKKINMREEIQQALSILREGGLILYPEIREAMGNCA